MEEKITNFLKQMSQVISEMVSLVYQGLMENDDHYLDRALNKERILDSLEKQALEAIIAISKSKQDKRLIFLGQAAQNIERMGDELRSLIERIEIKIAEKLYFSELGITQYREVFEKMQVSVKMTQEFFEAQNPDVFDKILRNGEEIKALVERYRLEHMERLTKGICQPRAANMFFDMLDFTGNIARHCTNIARTYKE